MRFQALLALSVWGWAARFGLARTAGSAFAIGAFAIAALWLELFGMFGYSAFPALLCGLESLALVVRGLAPARSGRGHLQMAGAGLAAGLGVLFRLDFGLAAAAAAAATIVLAHSMASDLPGRERWRGASRGLALFAAGAGLPVCLALIVLFAQGATLSAMIDALVFYPAVTFPEVRRLPPPAFSWKTLAFYVPAWVGILGLARGLLLLRRGVRGDAAALGWCALSLLLLAALPQARTRADLVHQLPVLLPSVALAAAWGHELFLRQSLRKAGALFLVPVFALAYLALPAASWLHAPPVTSDHDHGIPRAAGVALLRDQAAAVRAVRDSTAPEDFVFVGNGRHDRGVANDALFYFLAGRRYPTSHHNLLPGLTTRETVQRTIVSELQARGVRYVALCTAFDDIVEPNASRAAGSHLLDEHLRRAYGLSTTIGHYQIWLRR